MAQTFRISKLEKFIKKQMEVMKTREEVLDFLRKEESDSQVNSLMEKMTLEIEERRDCILELCEEFDIERPDF